MDNRIKKIILKLFSSSGLNFLSLFIAATFLEPQSYLTAFYFVLGIEVTFAISESLSIFGVTQKVNSARFLSESWYIWPIFGLSGLIFLPSDNQVFSYLAFGVATVLFNSSCFYLYLNNLVPYRNSNDYLTIQSAANLASILRLVFTSALCITNYFSKIDPLICASLLAAARGVSYFISYINFKAEGFKKERSLYLNEIGLILTVISFILVNRSLVGAATHYVPDRLASYLTILTSGILFSGRLFLNIILDKSHTSGIFNKSTKLIIMLIVGAILIAAPFAENPILRFLILGVLIGSLVSLGNYFLIIRNWKQYSVKKYIILGLSAVSYLLLTYKVDSWYIFIATLLICYVNLLLIIRRTMLRSSFKDLQELNPFG